jgi:hypothetical protein
MNLQARPEETALLSPFGRTCFVLRTTLGRFPSITNALHIRSFTRQDLPALPARNLESDRSLNQKFIYQEESFWFYT